MGIDLCIPRAGGLVSTVKYVTLMPCSYAECQMNYQLIQTRTRKTKKKSESDVWAFQERPNAGHPELFELAVQAAGACLQAPGSLVHLLRLPLPPQPLQLPLHLPNALRRRSRTALFHFV